MIVAGQVHHFNAALAGNDISVRCLLTITSVMMSRGLKVHQDGIVLLDLARVQDQAFVKIIYRSRRYRVTGMKSLLYKTINHKDVQRRAKTTAGFAFPELAAVFRRQCCQLPG